MINSENKYTIMQKTSYDLFASNWSPETPDPVVGTFHAHNKWDDYEHLFTKIDNQSEKIGIDFACGPGRNIVRYKGRFKRLDGVDISSVNIEKAWKYVADNDITDLLLYVNNGIDLDIIDSNVYDFVMSTIALQHICVHEIRKNIFKDIHRILKDGGIFTAQMGFGSPSPQTVGYYENHYDATETNRGCDVCIESADQLEKDLVELGFKNFNYTITTTGPGDLHPSWIFFNVEK